MSGLDWTSSYAITKDWLCPTTRRPNARACLRHGTDNSIGDTENTMHVAAAQCSEAYSKTFTCTFKKVDDDQTLCATFDHENFNILIVDGSMHLWNTHRSLYLNMGVFHVGMEYSHYAAKIVYQQGCWQSIVDETISSIPSPTFMKIKTESPKFS